MATIPKTVIFDSSGLVSLVKSDDQLHNKAVHVAEKLATDGWRLLVPYEVLAESLNTIGKLVNRRSAVIVGDALMEQYGSQELMFIQGEPHLVTSALQRLKSMTGAPSFVDCLVMACADEHQTKFIFGFDTTFRKNGYFLPDTK
jgi:predicted nucleic acid-binding protein